MKRYAILLLLIMFLSVTAHGQSFHAEFAARPHDLSARTHSQNDLNGNRCALIKIFVNDDVVKVSGIIGEPIKKEGNETWVYVPDGTKRVEVNTATHMPSLVDFSKYDIHHAESGVTYQLQLTDAAAGTTVKQDPGAQYLVLNVTPQNASVEVDGNAQVVNEGSAMVYLPYGTHTWRATAPGYATETGQVEIGHEKKVCEVNLQSLMATLKVECTTPDTEIYVNGQRRGTSSWSGSLTAGTYSVEGRLGGYHSTNAQSVVLGECESQTLTLPALQRMVGSLNVSYTPANAEVWLDGKQLGTSPDVFSDIGVGTHSLIIKKDGYQEETVNVTVTENKVEEVSGSLKKEYAADIANVAYKKIWDSEEGNNNNSKAKIITTIFNREKQPPIVGGVISNNISMSNIKQKGIIIGTNQDEMIISKATSCNNDETPNKLRFYDCTDLNERQFNTTLKRLYSNTRYYVKAYIIDNDGNVTYGNTETIEMPTFNRYNDRFDRSNVFHAFSNTLFDLVTDEIIDPSTDGFYYSTNEAPTRVSYQKGTSYNTSYKFATEWNYKLWYYHGVHCNKNKIVSVPSMVYNNGKLTITKNGADADKDISIYYSIDGNYFRPENYTKLYTEPIRVSAGHHICCYAISSDGYMSYTNLYVVR